MTCPWCFIILYNSMFVLLGAEEQKGEWKGLGHLLLFYSSLARKDDSPSCLYNLCHARYATAGRACSKCMTQHSPAWFIFFSVIPENTDNRWQKSINNRQIIVKIFDIACHYIWAHMIVLYIHCTVHYVFICNGYIYKYTWTFHSIRKMGRCVIYFCVIPKRLGVK